MATSPFPPPAPPRPIPTEPRATSRAAAARPNFSPVGLIAAVGVIFILIAAISVTADRWDTMGASMRATGLAVAALVTTLFAERVRAKAHTTALAIAIVGVGLAFPVGVATMASAGFTWPVCLAIGAVVAAPFAEWQRRRWPAMDVFGVTVRWFDIIQTCAFAGGSFGVAALLHLPAGLVAVAIAAILSLVGSNLRSVSLASLAVFAPALGVLANGGIGAGTLARAGVIGDQTGWSGPVVGVAAGAIAYVAGRRLSSRALQMLSPLLALVGVLTGLISIEAGPAVWWSLPGLALGGVAAIRRIVGDTVAGSNRSTIVLSRIADLAAGIGGGVAAALGFIVAAGTIDLDTSYTFTAAIWAIGLALSWSVVDEPFSQVALGGVAATATLAAVAVGPLVADIGVSWPPTSVIVGAVAIVAAGVAIWLGRGVLTAAIGLAIAAMTILGLPASAGPVVGFMLLGAWLAVAVLALTWCRPPLTVWSVGFVVIITSYAAGWIVSQDGASSASTLSALLFGALVAAGAACTVLPARRFAGWPVGLVGALTFAATCLVDITSPAVVAGFAAIAGAGIAWRRVVGDGWSNPLVGGAAGATVVSAIQLAVATVDGHATLYPAMLIGALVLLVVSTTMMGDAVTLTATTGAVAFAAACATVVTEIPEAWSAAVWFVLGLTAVVFGSRWQVPVAAVVGSAVALVSAIWWFGAVGLLDRLPEALMAVGATVEDATSVAVFVGLVVIAETLLRNSATQSVWLYAPAFTYITYTTATVEFERHPLWTIPFAIIVGVAAIVIGAQRKIVGLLVGGIALASAVIFVASRATLVAVPGWAWVGLGGVCLLGAALAVERVAGGWSGVRRQAAYLARTWR